MLEVIGSLAGIFTTMSVFPQVYKTIKTGSAGDFSTAGMIMMTTGVFSDGIRLLYQQYACSFC
ncbi:SemiSWEET family sugar transporter [Sporomusa termitida]|uniref:Uncharacterized protein n=1 Tax=Sporomusa termitida TaxID=2377 RepID=A0A517DS16_9FIRM|nr:PQ-loop domain-containing transporter [Sporomusa termitida]QDR80155.1 hypothetical protein SPTER_14720 [Sporomusa termitida]